MGALNRMAVPIEQCNVAIVALHRKQTQHRLQLIFHQYLHLLFFAVQQQAERWPLRKIIWVRVNVIIRPYLEFLQRSTRLDRSLLYPALALSAVVVVLLHSHFIFYIASLDFIQIMSLRQINDFMNRLFNAHLAPYSCQSFDLYPQK